MANEKILVVEDEGIVAMDIQNRVKRLGYAVPAIASSGEEAVKKAEETHPDLVLMDIRLKGMMDGIEAAGEIRERFDIPVVYLTAYADDETLQRAKITEPYGYILKPVRDRELHTSIEMALHKHGMEKKLRKEKIFSENIVATVPDSLLVLDSDLRIKSANRTFYETFQTEPEKVIGTRITEILHDKEGKLSTELTKLFGTEDMLENFELHYHSEKLGKRIFNITARRILVEEEEEEEEEELVVIQDVTELKKIEEALMIKDIAIASSNTAIALADFDGNLTYVNPSFLRMWGYDNDKELLGKSLSEFWQTEEQTAVIIGTLHEKGSWLGELVGSRKDGSNFDVLLLASLVKNKDDRPFCVMSSVVDITERKRAEEEIKKKNIELQRLNSELDDYVRFVSHDVRAPLRHIKALSLFINEDYGDKLDGNGKEYIRKITTTCDGAETMINELLELARMKGIELVREEVNLEDVIKAVETELESFLKENNGRIEVDEHLPSLLAHRAWMKELFLNLIMNGVKHNDKEEKVVRIGFEDEEDTLLFVVADNGIGIEDKYRAEIFRPFKRVNVVEEGTGLGLSLCKKVVELHEGKIWVESEIGKGSTFFFSFPKNTASL